MNPHDYSEEAVEAALTDLQLVDAPKDLRSRVLSAGEVEWDAAPTADLRGRVLAAAEGEWAPVDAPEPRVVTWMTPLIYIAGSMAAALVLVFLGATANDRMLAKWQNPTDRKSAESAIAKIATPEVAAPRLAWVTRVGSAEDLLRHVRTSREFLENPGGDQI